METYKASLDTTAKIMTAFVFLMAIAGIVMTFLLNPWYAGLVVAIIPAFTIVVTYFYSVKSYQITNDKLIIKRPVSIFDKEIALSEIQNVRLLNKEDFKWTIRTFGDGGLFGYYGLFANSKLGSFKMYSTNAKNRILLVLRGAELEIVLSPDDAAMADALQKRLKS